MIITPNEYWLITRLADCLSLMDATDLVLLINEHGQVAVTHRTRLLYAVTHEQREALWGESYKIMSTLVRDYIHFVDPPPTKENL